MSEKDESEKCASPQDMTKDELQAEMEKIVDDLKGGKEEKAGSHDEIGATSIKSATLNMATQMSFRVITFLLNAFVLRHISRDVMGLINVRLNLLDDTILFLSREAFRLACIGHKEKGGWAGVLNLMWLCVPISVVWSLVLSWVWINLLPAPPDHLQEQYLGAVYLVSISAVIQMFAEVPWLLAQVFLFVRLRVILDFVWMMTRVVVLVYAVSAHQDDVVTVWAYGHFAAGLLFVLGYYLAFILILRYGNGKDECKHSTVLPFTSIRQFLPTLENGTHPINKEYRSVAISFLGQGVMKQLLTEGERYLMTFLNLLTLSQQGIFDVVSNLGSLAARFIFRPIEESCYFFFTQQWTRGRDWTEQDPDQREKVLQGLTRILRLMLMLGLVIFSFGFSYSDLLLRLYGGNNLVGDGGTNLLRAQCLLIVFLALNGVSECFARSVMTDVEITDFNKKLVFLSVSYLLLTWGMTSLLGPVGLVLANCANMAIRIHFSVEVIRSTFSGVDPSPLEALNPDNDILFIILSAGTCCQLSEQFVYFHYPAVHFVLGGTLFVVVVGSIIVKEEFVLAFIVQKYRTIFGGEKTIKTE